MTDTLTPYESTHARLSADDQFIDCPQPFAVKRGGGMRTPSWWALAVPVLLVIALAALALKGG